jgi:hypothetical protein
MKEALENKGKTLMLYSSRQLPSRGLMYALFAQVLRLMTAGSRSGPAVIPRLLLEKAEARAGSNPHQAAELRSAALAYLRVVR